jgi:hypothetical protein
MRPVVLAVAVACLTAPAFAQEPPFVASRPGATEGAIAVPKGYLQAETELGSYSRTKDAGATSEGFSLAATTLRYGLGNGYDAELVVQPWLRSSVRGPGFKETDSGFGDVTLRLLKNLMGQDGEGPSLAIIGYVSFPAAENGLGAGRSEGGAIITGGFPLTESWGAAWTVGAAARHAGSGDYRGEISGALQLNHAVSNSVTAYAEVAASRLEHEDTAATFDIGAAWLIDTTVQLDAGVNFGLSDAADDIAVFAGWAHRF